ncbi:hypothetical protein [Pseudomonas sp. FP1740]|uniref:hypothetical protein n=1 Tax=Pseudomonas sp. FP1740 TaxID=2954078 RepID=UPI00273717BF|nr:hypothetical protein [Pseudomonas sp. FP1740]WLG46412.1 hypothetical protein PSH69_07290 [Pseudomonas sp. FP1740]
MPVQTLAPWEYPALASKRILGLLWFVLAMMTIIAGLNASEIFYSTTAHQGPMELGFKLGVIATSFKVLGILAPLTPAIQRRQIRRMREEHKRRGVALRVRPTYRAALIAGGLLMAASQAITLFLEYF